MSGQSELLRRSRMGRFFGTAGRPVRFVLVGGINTALAYMIYAGFVFAGLPFYLANLLSLLFGVTISFYTQSRLVFDHRGWGRIIRFTGFWLLIYAVQTSAIAVLVSRGMHAATAGLVVLPATVLISYFVQRYLVFNKRGGERGGGL